MKIKKLMVANRGEIAIRIFRAATELKLRTVAIYTFEDRYSLHRYKADEAYQIGEENDPLKPYLNFAEILKVAKENDIDAIHPGYGFLSENDQFAEACIEAGIIWIGPQPSVMRSLGDKMSAKKLAIQANVPIVPASEGAISSYAEAVNFVDHIGLPVMVKAATGGGGRGMRVVHKSEELSKAFQEAGAEAMTAFGDSTVFIEKFIEDPKHIEVQILADEHGNMVHLFERDCSVQRRFQKVVEVAPAFNLKESSKKNLYRYAVAISKAAGYTNAGTVEFLIDNEENIYFIEVNTRIQVEHTITEEITGIDLVKSQILIAAGFPLTHPKINISGQESVKFANCAIQCRVTTEDPSNGFKPDYGTLIAYRSAAGFGIRLDAGSAYPGAKISPFFDSLLVKISAKGRNVEEAADRMRRALMEFRIRGVKTNIGFLLNVLDDPTFKSGKATVQFIQRNPDLLAPPKWRNRSTKLLRYLADIIVNGNGSIKFKDDSKSFMKPHIPEFLQLEQPKGTKDWLNELGRDAFIDRIKNDNQIYFTDTTFRDAHQSLLATRMRTIDMLNVAKSFSHNHGGDLFSMEVWGGATFDVAMRFLQEDPWKRLEKIRKAIPNVLLQMLLRGSNAVGYTAYPDNLIIEFIKEASNTGIDVFRIFDSLNWVEAMKTSIHTVINETDALAEACICYTGDVSDPSKTKFNLQYYIDLARELEDTGIHMIAIKDMAGLLKPRAATILVEALKEHLDCPIHLHTHDTSSIQSTTYQSAINAGVDIVDVAMSSMSGLTSQPNFNSVVSMLKGHPRERQIDFHSLNEFSEYWYEVRRMYYPFETELRSGSADVYEHEIPGGQYSNLRPQARALGLEKRFEEVKANYKVVNDMLGGIIKVTPSSKVVGDTAIFMTANNLKVEDVYSEKGRKLAWPESLKSLLRGDLGQIKGGFPPELQKIVLGKEQPYTDRPNAHMDPVDFDEEIKIFRKKYGEDRLYRDFISNKLYPKVYDSFFTSQEEYGDVSKLPTPSFFYGLKPNEEILVEIGRGKKIIIKFLNITEPNVLGMRLVLFSLNGQTRSIEVRDRSIDTKVEHHAKARGPGQVGAPLQGSLSRVLVEAGQHVEVNTPLFIIEAMKMESTITAPIAGKIHKVHIPEKTMIEQDDLVIEFE
ncbi:MAG: pyruvate carboxylase [Bacteroidia bacterium]|nr:pyruvate carboxylase [Bacteroidia bacterium]